MWAVPVTLESACRLVETHCNFFHKADDSLWQCLDPRPRATCCYLVDILSVIWTYVDSAVMVSCCWSIRVFFSHVFKILYESGPVFFPFPCLLSLFKMLCNESFTFSRFSVKIWSFFFFTVVSVQILICWILMHPCKLFRPTLYSNHLQL